MDFKRIFQTGKSAKKELIFMEYILVDVYKGIHLLIVMMW